MHGAVASLYRHPVKGFTPERLEAVGLEPGGFFPADRLYAVENGPSGFDPAAPVFISKTRFAALTSVPRVALARTAYADETGWLTVQAVGEPPFGGSLLDPAGRTAFAAWLTRFLGEEARGPLKVVHAPGHRFTDHPRGAVSVINLASVRDLASRMGRPVDPLRFRANVYVEGWPAWCEMDCDPGALLNLGQATLRVFKPIVRCAATHVDPASGLRDLEVVAGLREHYGHIFCGLYVDVVGGGRVEQGGRADLG